MAHGERNRTNDSFVAVKKGVARRKMRKAKRKAEKKARVKKVRALNERAGQAALEMFDQAASEMAGAMDDAMAGAKAKAKADTIRAEKFNEATRECQAAQEADESRGLDEEDVLGEELEVATQKVVPQKVVPQKVVPQAPLNIPEARSGGGIGALGVLSNEQGTAVQAIMNHIKMTADKEKMKVWGFMAYTPEHAKKEIKNKRLHKLIPEEGAVWALRGMEEDEKFRIRLMREFFKQIGKNKSKGFEIIGWEVKDKMLNAYAAIEVLKEDPISWLFGEKSPTIDTTAAFNKLSSKDQMSLRVAKTKVEDCMLKEGVNRWASLAYTYTEARNTITSKVIRAKILEGEVVWEIRTLQQYKGFSEVVKEFKKLGKKFGFKFIGNEKHVQLQSAYMSIMPEGGQKEDPISWLFGERAGK